MIDEYKHGAFSGSVPRGTGSVRRLGAIFQYLVELERLGIRCILSHICRSSTITKLSIDLHIMSLLASVL